MITAKYHKFHPPRLNTYNELTVLTNNIYNESNFLGLALGYIMVFYCTPNK